MIPTEREVQRQVVSFLRKIGCTVAVTSDNRTSHIAKGLPDLWVMWPAKGEAFWVECKRPGGTASPEQTAFATLAAQCDTPVVTGGLAEVRSYLAAIRTFPKPSAGALGPA